MILEFALHDRTGNHGEASSLFNCSLDCSCVIHLNRTFQAYPKSLQLTAQVLRRGGAPSRQNELLESCFLGRKHISFSKSAAGRRYNCEPIRSDPLDPDIPGPQMLISFCNNSKIKGIFLNQATNSMRRMDGDKQFDIRESLSKRRQNFGKQIDTNDP